MYLVQLKFHLKCLQIGMTVKMSDNPTLMTHYQLYYKRVVIVWISHMYKDLFLKAEGFFYFSLLGLALR